MNTDPLRGARVNIMPTMRYRDARAAIDWLCKAFGFEAHLIVPGEGDEVLHAQLTFGTGMVMIGSVRDDEHGQWVRAPEPGAPGTQSAYVIVADATAHHARAQMLGANIVRELVEEAHGGAAYSCTDPEGHLWNFGEYDPFAESC